MIQLPQDLLLDIKNSFNALLHDIGSYPPPEATAYLTLLGREMGYIKSSEVKHMADTLYTYYQTFFKQLPAKVKAFQKLINITFFNKNIYYLLKLAMLCIFSPNRQLLH
jgi:hypothetical protein